MNARSLEPGEPRRGVELVMQHAKFYTASVRENLVSALPNRGTLDRPTRRRLSASCSAASASTRSPGAWTTRSPPSTSRRARAALRARAHRERAGEDAARVARPGPHRRGGVPRPGDACALAPDHRRRRRRRHRDRPRLDRLPNRGARRSSLTRVGCARLTRAAAGTPPGLRSPCLVKTRQVDRSRGVGRCDHGR